MNISDIQVQAIVKAVLTALALPDGSSGTNVPVMNVDTPKTTISGSSTSIMAKIVELARVSKANVPNLETALMYAYQGVSGADMHRNEGSPYYINQTVRRWIENVGGLAQFRTLARELYEQSAPTVAPTVEYIKEVVHAPTIKTSSDLLNMCNTYFWERQEAGTGFMSSMFVIGKGTYKGNDCAIVRKGETDVLYAVGNLFSTGVKANRSKKVVAEVVNDNTYTAVRPKEVFIPTNS